MASGNGLPSAPVLAILRRPRERLDGRPVDPNSTTDQQTRTISEIVKGIDESTYTAAALAERLSIIEGQGGGQVCGKAFKTGDLSFTCRTCATESTCVLCFHCFDASRHLHEDHDVSCHFAGEGGTCDCGDEEAWQPLGMCEKHAPHAACGPANSQDDPSAAFPLAVRVSLRSAFYAIALFLQETAADVACAYGTMPGVNGEGVDTRFEGRYGPRAPAELAGAVTPPPLVPAPAPAPVPATASPEDNSDNSDDDLPPLITSRKTTLTAAAGAHSPGAALYTVVIHNDDVHTYDEVRAVFAGPGGQSDEVAKGLTKAVDENGEAAMPAMYCMPEETGELTKLHAALTQAGLQFSIEPAGLQWAQTLSTSVLQFCATLTKASAGAAHLLAEAWADVNVFPETGRSELKVGEVDEVTNTFINYDVLSTHSECVNEPVGAASRFSLHLAPTMNSLVDLRRRGPLAVCGASSLLALVQYDMHQRQTWRTAIHDIYTRSLRVSAFKHQFGRAFLTAYPYLISKWSRGVGTAKPACIFEFSVQLMTVPSIVSSVMRDGGLVHLLPGNLWHVLSMGLMSASPSSHMRVFDKVPENQYNGAALPCIPFSPLSVGSRVSEAMKVFVLRLNSPVMVVRDVGVRWGTACRDMEYAFRQPGFANAVVAAGWRNRLALGGTFYRHRLHLDSAIQPVRKRPSSSSRHEVLTPFAVGWESCPLLTDGVTRCGFQPGHASSFAHLTSMWRDHLHDSHSCLEQFHTSPLLALLAGFTLASGLDGHYRKSGRHIEFESSLWTNAVFTSLALADLSNQFWDNIRVAVPMPSAQAGLEGKGGVEAFMEDEMDEEDNCAATSKVQVEDALHPVFALQSFGGALDALLSNAAEIQHVLGKAQIASTKMGQANAQQRLEAALDGCVAWSSARRQADLGTYGLVLRSWQHPVSVGPVTMHPNAHRFVADMAVSIAQASVCTVQGAPGPGGAPGVIRMTCIDPCYAPMQWQAVGATPGRFPLAHIPVTATGMVEDARLQHLVNTELLGPPLRSLAFAGQIAQGLWVRNGSEHMTTMLQHYSQGKVLGHTMAMYDRDVRAVQLAIRFLAPQRALAALLAEWELLPFFETPVVRTEDAESLLSPVAGTFVHPLYRPAAWTDAMPRKRPGDRYARDSAEELRAVLCDYAFPEPCRLVDATVLKLSDQTALMAEFLRMFSVIVTELPLAAGGAMAPPDALFHIVEGEGAAHARVYGRSLSTPLIAEGEMELVREASKMVLGLAPSFAPSFAIDSPGTESRKRRRTVTADESLASMADEQSDTQDGRPSPSLVQSCGFFDHIDLNVISDPSHHSPAGEGQDRACVTDVDSVLDQSMADAESSRHAQLTDADAHAALNLLTGERVVEGPVAHFDRTRRLALRRELVHFLASGRDGAGKPRSAITKVSSGLLGEKRGRLDNSLVSSILDEIAEYRDSRESGEGGTYVLKDAVLVAEYDWVYPHLNRGGHTQANQWWSEKRMAAATSCGAAASCSTLLRARPIAPSPPPANPAYLPVRRMLHTVATAHMLRTLLSDAVLSALCARPLSSAGGSLSPAALPPGLEWAGGETWRQYTVEMAGPRTSDAVLRGALHVLTLALHTWPTHEQDVILGDPVTVSTVFADALTCAQLQLPYGGPWAPEEEVRIMDVARKFGAPCPSIQSSLHQLYKAHNVSEEVREGSAWCLQVMMHVHHTTAAAVKAEMGDELDAAAVQERAAEESARKAELAARKLAAQERAMSGMKSKQARLLARFASDEDENAGGTAGLAAAVIDARAVATAAADEASEGVMAIEGEDSLLHVHTDPSTLLGCASVQMHVQTASEAMDDADKLFSNERLLSDLIALETPSSAPSCILCSGAADSAAGGEDTKGGITYLGFIGPSAQTWHATGVASRYRTAISEKLGLPSNAPLSGGFAADSPALQPEVSPTSACTQKPLAADIAARAGIDGAPRVGLPAGELQSAAVAAAIDARRAIRTVDLCRQKTCDRYDGACKSTEHGACGIGMPTNQLQVSALMPLSSTHSIGITFCGHAAHSGCLMAYSTAQSRAMSAPTNMNAQELMKYLQPGEFACPLCRGIVNAAVQHDGSTWPLAAMSRGAVQKEIATVAKTAAASLTQARVRKAMIEALHGRHTSTLFSSSQRTWLSRTGLATLPMPSLLDGVCGLAMQQEGPGCPGWMATPASIVRTSGGRGTDDGQLVSVPELMHVRWLALSRALRFLPASTEAVIDDLPDALRGSGLGAGFQVSPFAALEKGTGNLLATFGSGSARAPTASVQGMYIAARKLYRIAASRWVLADGRVEETHNMQTMMTRGLADMASPLDMLLMHLVTVGHALDMAELEVFPSGTRPAAPALVRHRLQFTALLGQLRHAEAFVHPLHYDAMGRSAAFLASPTQGSAVTGTQVSRVGLELGAPPSQVLAPQVAAPAAAAPNPSPPAVPAQSLPISVMVPAPLLASIVSTLAHPFAAAGLNLQSGASAMTVSLMNPLPDVPHSGQLIEALANVVIPTGPMAETIVTLMTLLGEAALADEELAQFGQGIGGAGATDEAEDEEEEEEGEEDGEEDEDLDGGEWDEYDGEESNGEDGIEDNDDEEEEGDGLGSVGPSPAPAAVATLPAGPQHSGSPLLQSLTSAFNAALPASILPNFGAFLSAAAFGIMPPALGAPTPPLAAPNGALLEMLGFGDGNVPPNVEQALASLEQMAEQLGGGQGGFASLLRGVRGAPVESALPIQPQHPYTNDASPTTVADPAVPCTLFEPLVHHPYRSGLAVLLAHGQARVVPTGMDKGTQFWTSNKAGLKTDWDRKGGIPTSLAVFLRADDESSNAPPYGTATPVHAHYIARLQAMNIARLEAGRERIDLRGPLTEEHAGYLLSEENDDNLHLSSVDPFHLLLSLTATAPSPMHVLHCACLCLCLAVSVTREEGAGYMAGVTRFARRACTLLALVATPTASESAVGPAVQAFLAWADGLREGEGAHGYLHADLAPMLQPGQTVRSAMSALPPSFSFSTAVYGIGVGVGVASEAQDGSFHALLQATGPSSGAARPLPSLRPTFNALSLIPLPPHFDVLHALVKGKPCAACGKAPSGPALCLTCGQLLCAAEACCRRGPRSRSGGPFSLGRQPGELTRHSRTCGGGEGVFILMGLAEASATLLVRGKHAAWAGSVYADSHGEADIGLKRASLLRLHPARYAALTELWARGGIAREVAKLRQAADRHIIDDAY